MKSLVKVLSIGALLVAVAPFAKADTVSSLGAGPIFLDSANGAPPSSLALAGNTANITAVGQTFAQQIILTSGYDGAGGPIDFTLDDPITVDGVTSVYTINGTFLVSSTTAPDTLTLLAGSPMKIGGVTIQLQQISFFDNPPFPGGVVSNENANFLVTGLDVAPPTVPEPSSLALLGTGILGAVGTLRRRFKA